jgi:hypothetical protein
MNTVLQFTSRVRAAPPWRTRVTRMTIPEAQSAVQRRGPVARHCLRRRPWKEVGDKDQQERAARRYYIKRFHDNAPCCRSQPRSAETIRK